MFRRLFIRIRFRLLRIFTKKGKRDAIYLTFDDGPEPGITEFVLDTLKEYGYQASFFCVGENALRYPKLISRILEEGHALGSHTFSHANSFSMDSQQYMAEVRRGAAELNTLLFRPPWGSLSIRKAFRLKRDGFKIYLWDMVSHDTEREMFDCEASFAEMKRRTRNGSIVLFHFCTRHEEETRRILPLYLAFLKEKGLICRKLE